LDARGGLPAVRSRQHGAFNDRADFYIDTPLPRGRRGCEQRTGGRGGESQSQGNKRFFHGVFLFNRRFKKRII
jgi:hypothetical protein